MNCLIYLSRILFKGCCVQLLILSSMYCQGADIENIDVSFSLYLAGSHARSAIAGQYEREVIAQEIPELYLYSNGEAVRIALDPGQETRPIRYHGPPQFSLYQKSGTDDTGQALLEPVIDVSLPAGWNKGMLVLFERGRNYELFPLETSVGSARRNTALLYNISSTSIVCLAGGKKVALDPFRSASIELNEVKADLQLSIKCAAKAGDEWVYVYSGTQTVKKGAYYIFLLTPDSTGRSFRIIRFKHS